MSDPFSKWVDLSTIIAATAGLWALSFGWLTYAMSVRQQNRDEFLALKNIVEGLKVELEEMRAWTGAGGPGYSKTMTPAGAPADWSDPGRVIWRFGSDAIANLSGSPYLFRLRDIVVPFARLKFSISKLFQLYGEYRSFVNSNSGVFAARPPWYKQVILDYNFHMHVRLIGGADSDDPTCLYKTYHAATSALCTFDKALAVNSCPLWFWIGHFIAAMCAGSGILLLVRCVNP